MKKKKKKIREIFKNIIPLAIIVILFIFSSLFVQENQDKVKELIETQNFVSIVLYILILIVSIVFMPVSAMPLMPIASSLWGWFTAGVFAVVGWTIGSVIAFFVAREYGKSLFKNLIPLKKIENFIPEENLFFTVVFLNMVLPFDGLSYALGLFTKMKTKSYLAATFIGLIPFSFVFSYLGTLSITYQILGFLLATIIVFISIFKIKKRKISEKKGTL